MATLHGTPWLLRDDSVDSIFKGAQIGSQIYRNQQDNRERKATEAYRLAQMAKVQEEQRIAAAEEARMFAGTQAYQAEAAEAIKANPGKSPDEILPPIFLKHVPNMVPRSAIPGAFNNARSQDVQLQKLQGMLEAKDLDRTSREGIAATKSDEQTNRLLEAIQGRKDIAASNNASREGIADKNRESNSALGWAKFQLNEKKQSNAPEFMAAKAKIIAIENSLDKDKEAQVAKVLADYHQKVETGVSAPIATEEQKAAKEALKKLQEDRLKIMKEILSGNKKPGPDIGWNPMGSYQEKLAEIDANMAEANRILNGDAAPVAPADTGIVIPPSPKAATSKTPKVGDEWPNYPGFRYNGKFPPSDKRAWDKK